MMYIVWNRKFFCPYIFLCVFVLLLYSGRIHAQDNGTALRKVVIDPGHGGIQSGAIGAKSKEKDIVLDVALRLGKMINEKYSDVEVIYTRKTDEMVELYKRADIANKAHADLFISIHTNSVAKGSRCPSGTETFVMGNSKSEANMEVAKRENSVILYEEDYEQRYAGFDPNNPASYIMFSLMQNSFLNQSLDFAAEIQSQFNKAKRVDRQVKQAPFLVLHQTSMPSVLVEIGFICNPAEESFLTSAAGKETITSSIFQAFSSYKAKIEDRSSLPTGDAPAQIQPTVSNQSQPTGTQNSKPEIQNPKKVEFCVQISSSSIPKDPTPNNFKKHKGVERIKISDNNYKYIIGRTTNYTSAQETLKTVRKDFSDAFVVGIVDGKIIPATEGLKLINK